MTPPGDGGPDLAPCPWCGGPIRYDYNRRLDALDTDPIEPSNVWLGCCNEECPVQPMTAGYETTEEADAAWNARPTTRDAALREEGRVQGLREAMKWCEAEQSVWAAQVGGYAKGSRNALVAKVRENAMKGAVAELRLLAPPAAPQGSPLPGGDEPPCSLACKNACPPPLHLWKQAAGSRDEYHRLLVLHGYAYAQPRNPPDGGALEGELAEALRAVVVGRQCSRLICGGDCRCDVGRAKRLLASYDASKAIPQSGDEKEGT